MVKEWDYESFRAAATLAADARNINKEQLFHELASILNISTRTLMNYQTPKAVPGMDVANKIRDFFGVDFFTYDQEATQLLQHLSAGKMELSDFVKTRVWDSLLAIERFIMNIHLDEEKYYQLLGTLDENALGMPVEIANKIEGFVEERIAPLIFDEDTAFALCRESHVGYENDDGVFVVENETAFLAAIFSVIAGVEQDFRKLAGELHPLLVS